MKTTRLLLILLLCAGSLLLSGCSTFNSRARQKAVVFNNLDAETQQRLRDRNIAIGDTMEMVFISLGSPDGTQRRTTEAGESITWVYRLFYQAFSGHYTTRYITRVIYDPVRRVYRVIHVPVREPVFETRSEDRTRINFIDGRVRSIEQVK